MHTSVQRVVDLRACEYRAAERSTAVVHILLQNPLLLGQCIEKLCDAVLLNRPVVPRLETRTGGIGMALLVCCTLSGAHVPSRRRRLTVDRLVGTYCCKIGDSSPSSSVFP